MSVAEQGPIDLGLTALAFLYANGELEEADVLAFENRLADDQRARDALCQAVQLTRPGDGELPQPDPAYRDRVLQELRGHPSPPTPLPNGERGESVTTPLPNEESEEEQAYLPDRAGWWSVLLGPRMYHGHPLCWLLAGALAASLLVAFLTMGQKPATPPPRRPMGNESRPDWSAPRWRQPRPGRPIAGPRREKIAWNLPGQVGQEEQTRDAQREGGLCLRLAPCQDKIEE